MWKSQTAREWAIEVGLSFREAEWRLDAELFLDKYPRWEIEAPHWCIFLHEMFLHAAEEGQKEAERFIWWGHQCSLPRTDPEADLTTMKLVGYQTSHQEIRDFYHSVYLLRRLPGPLPCGPQQTREAIQDILSSLRNCLHRWVYPIPAKDTGGAVTESWSRPRGREDPHEEALWEARTACQRVLEAAQVLESKIERLSQGLRDVQHAFPCSHSSSCLWSQSLDRWPRSWSRPWQERRVTFWELEVELDPEEGPYRGALGCSSRIFLESGDGILPSTQRQETAHPPGSNDLLVGRPFASRCSWGIPGPLTDGSSDGAHCGNSECQLHCEGQDHWGDLYGHHDHFCGVCGPQWPKPGDPSQGAHHRGYYRPLIMD